MKILHINEHLDWKGGVETYLLSIIPELEKRGIETAVVFSKGDSALVRQAYHAPGLSQGDHAAEKRGGQEIRQILAEYQPDIIHLHQVYNIGAIEACLEHGPVVVHGHDYRYLCPASTFYYKRTGEVCTATAGPACFARTLTRHCLSPRPRYAFPYYQRVRWFTRQSGRIAHVVAPSESARQRFLAVEFAEEQVTTLPYFCPLSPLDEPRPLPEQPLILFIGRIRPNKGVRYFIEALGQLPDHVRGLMVGDFTDAARRDVLAQATAAGCGTRLELQGWAPREKIRELFSRASVFVFPSIWPETLGIVGIEALSCGVPVVASDIGGVREWLIPEETGILVPPKSSNALAEGIRRLVDDRVLNDTMGRNGLALISERFSVDYHVNRLLGIYESVLS